MERTEIRALWYTQSFWFICTQSRRQATTHRNNEQSSSRKSYKPVQYAKEDPTNAHAPDKPTAKCRMTIGKISPQLRSPDAATAIPPSDRPTDRAQRPEAVQSRAAAFPSSSSLAHLLYLLHSRTHTHTESNHTLTQLYTIHRAAYATRRLHNAYRCVCVWVCIKHTKYRQHTKAQSIDIPSFHIVHDIKTHASDVCYAEPTLMCCVARTPRDCVALN